MPEFFIYTSVKLPGNLPGFVRIKAYPRGKRILVISPHSDDVSVSCGATIKALAKFNRIVPVLFFSGYRGIEGKDREQATKIREEEMEKEARVLGIEKPIFLKLSSYEIKRPIVRKDDVLKVKQTLKRQGPDIIFLPKKDDLQSRHKLATAITLKALRGCAPPDLFFYESPWSLFDNMVFNVAFVFSKEEIAESMKAIRVHHSQLKRTRFDRAVQSFAAFRGAVMPEQRVFGYGEDTKGMSKLYVEAFKLRKP